MQLVYEFGASELEPVLEAIQRAVGNMPYDVRCLPNDSDSYGPTDDSLASAAFKLKEGVIPSFTLRPKNGLIRYALVICPFFDGQPLSLYLGTIEYLGDDYRNIWNLLLGIPGLKVACLGFEEGVEIEDSMLSVECFPWSEWPLVIGALKVHQSGAGPWTIKEGPEMKWFTKAS